ncbi:MAG: diguanylate cyclase [Anaerolineae bacterium]|nr:diguanylate cyclase [Anaerolineae bacterium]
MQIQWAIFAVILILNTIAAVVLGVMVLRRRNAPGGITASVMFFALSVWTLAYAMITISNDMPTKIFWLRVENIGILSVPILWFTFTIEYTLKEKRFHLIWRILLWVIPLTSLIFLLSSNWFHLYYQALTPMEANGTGPLVITRGGWYPVQLVAAYGSLAAGFLLMLWTMFRLRDLYRRQLIFLLIGLVVPVLVNLFYQYGKNLFPEFYIPVDLTPISLTITAGFVSVGVFGLRMFDLVPIARNLVLESLPELVLVVDAYNRVLDANRTALAWFGKSSGDVIGKNLMDIFKLWPGLASRFLNTSELSEEIEIPGNPPRTLEMLISPIFNKSGDIEGKVIVARDISARKTIENEAKRANQALKLQLAEIETLRIQLQEQAVRDSLTGLYNRRHMAYLLDQAVEKTQQRDAIFSVAAVALDDFERINEKFGHKCGDVVLLACANRLDKKVKSNEVLCRYGGAKFVVLLPGLDQDQAIQRAKEWQGAISEKTIEYEGETLPEITISVGVSTFPKGGIESEALLQAADRALYEAKSHGHNQLSPKTA